MVNRSLFMRNVWAHFRRVALPGRPFDRKLFGQVLAFMWKSERVRIAAERERRASANKSTRIATLAPAKPLSPMEARIDGLKYLSARYAIGIMEREIRAEYAHA